MVLSKIFRTTNRDNDSITRLWYLFLTSGTCFSHLVLVSVTFMVGKVGLTPELVLVYNMNSDY